jgi:uncharacterized protein (TIGR02246 family)
VKHGKAQDADERAVSVLYHALLRGWNARNARDMAALFAPDGSLVGFDGSQVDGRTDIESHLRQIFAHHPTPAFVGKVRAARFLTKDVAVVRAVAGMVPPGRSDLEPALNAIQTLVVANQDGAWRIAVLQNTPAAFHGRPELAQSLTEELRGLLRESPPRTPDSQAQ